MYPDVHSLLAAHGLAAAREEPLTNAGYSGSALSTLVRDDGQAFVLKRMSIERDWIMRATHDASCREVAFATSPIDLGQRLRTPNLNAGHDGDGYALLMQDITPQLLRGPMINDSQLDGIIGGMAALHRLAVPATPLPWCPLDRRLLLLSPDGSRIAAAYRAPVARDLMVGWPLFEQRATPRAAALVRALHIDPTPLLQALARLPPAFLHGDLKLDNIGLDERGRTCLIDWAMTLVAPAPVELGWFLAVNSRRLPASLDAVLERYAAAAGIDARVRALHDGLAAVCGLVLRGWRKALDAGEGEPEELRWWCDRAEAAADLL